MGRGHEIFKPLTRHGPVGLFKSHDLCSLISDGEVVTTLLHYVDLLSTGLGICSCPQIPLAF